MDEQHEIFQDSMLSHHDGQEKDGQHVMRDRNGNTADQQEPEPVDTSLKRPPIPLQIDGNVDDDQDYNPNGQLERKHQELLLQDDGERMHNGNGDMPNQQQLDPVHIRLERPSIILQKDGSINDDKDGNSNGQLQKKFQEQFQGQGDDHGHNDPDKTHQQDEHVTPVRYFDIWIYHYPFFQDGHLLHLEYPMPTITRVPQWQPSFVVATRNGPGPHYAAIFVSMIPDLHLCNNFDDFILRLQLCFTDVVGEEVQDPTNQDLIPGYDVRYYLLEPPEEVRFLDGFPWEEFKSRLALVTAWEF